VTPEAQNVIAMGLFILFVLGGISLVVWSFRSKH
jgi:hypothetical protein